MFLEFTMSNLTDQIICQLSLTFFTITSTFLCLVLGNAIPETGIANDIVLPPVEDEWELVVYPTKKGEQCGGTSKEYFGSNTGAQCKQVQSSACAEVSVNVGFASCNFTFRKDGCDKGEKKEVVVEKKGKKKVTMDDIKFVTVSCKK